MVEECVDFVIGEGNLGDAAIEHDDLLDDSVDEVLELKVADTHGELGKIDAAMHHGRLEEKAGGFAQELFVGQRAGEDGRLLRFLEFALQMGDGILQVLLLSQEVGLWHLVLGVEEKVHESRQSTSVLLELSLQVSLAGLCCAIIMLLISRLIFCCIEAAPQQGNPHAA